MLLGKEEVIGFLPHRDPFLFIDSIESVTYVKEFDRTTYDPKNMLGAVVVAHYHVPEDLEIFKGHFPGNPILPGVIQTEMTAQASTFALYDVVKDPKTTKLDVALLNVTSAKYRKPVRPGMDLTIEVSCNRVRGSMMSYDGKIMADGEVVSEATFMATVNIIQ